MMVRKLVEEFDMRRLNVNIDEMKYMLIGAKELMADKSVVKQITEYKYLRVTLT